MCIRDREEEEEEEEEEEGEGSSQKDDENMEMDDEDMAMEEDDDEEEDDEEEVFNIQKAEVDDQPKQLYRVLDASKPAPSGKDGFVGSAHVYTGIGHSAPPSGPVPSAPDGAAR